MQVVVGCNVEQLSTAVSSLTPKCRSFVVLYIKTFYGFSEKLVFNDFILLTTTLTFTCFFKFLFVRKNMS